MSTEREQQQEASLVAQAKALRALTQMMQERWPAELEWMALQARIAKARYDALLKEGFTLEQALQLCTKKVEM